MQCLKGNYQQKYHLASNVNCLIALATFLIELSGTQPAAKSYVKVEGDSKLLSGFLFIGYIGLSLFSSAVFRSQ
jgi:hypothetical protein